MKKDLYAFQVWKLRTIVVILFLYLYWNDFSLKIFYILRSAEIWVVAVAKIAMEYVRIMLPICICLHCFGIKCLESGSTEERVLMFLYCFILMMHILTPDWDNSHKYAADNWWHCSLHCSMKKLFEWFIQNLRRVDLWRKGFSNCDIMFWISE